MVPPRKRRRVVRKSEATDYDRNADSKVFVSAFDDERVVVVDPDQEDEPTGLQFYKEQMPPHYGQ